MDGIGLLALDGARNIGGSKLLLGYDDTQVMLDFGTSFHNYGRYYEEFLKPRSTGGLLDFVTMGVLPDARGLYREDLMHPELELKGPEVGRIDALILSHPHADHFGDMGFLKLDVPVVTSTMSAAIVKAIADTGKSDIGKDYIYPSMRQQNKSGDAVIIGSLTKKEAQGAAKPGRDLVLNDGNGGKDFLAFWNFTPSVAMAEDPKRCKPCVPGEVVKCPSSVKFASYPVDHSVRGACAHVFPTSNGNVIYTGDLRMHGKGGHMTEEFVSAAKSPRPYALIIEGTRVGRASDASYDEERPPTEQEVHEHVREKMSGMEGEFVIADFGPRNIERLETFLDVAEENHRKMVVTVKDAYLLYAMHAVDPKVPVPGDGMLVYDCPKGKESKYEEFILRDQYPDAKVTADRVRRAPGDYVVSFSFFDLKHLVDMRPDGGHYMYSSCEAFSEEQEIDFVRMNAWLRKFGLEPHGLSFEEYTKGDGEKGIRPVFPKKGKESLHASGHATKEDLVRIVETLDPEVVIPVHTTAPGWFKETFGGQRKVVLPEEGSWVNVSE